MQLAPRKLIMSKFRSICIQISASIMQFSMDSLQILYQLCIACLGVITDLSVIYG
jgi:hypothetical protein